MPKTQDTRKQRAAELMRLLESGPILFRGHGVERDEDAMHHMRIWIDSWIIPLVKDLVPELREKRE